MVADRVRLQAPELVCPAGTPAALRAAVDAGADAIYCGFQNASNARNFPGLNFTVPELHEAVRYAHARSAKVMLATNTFPPAGKLPLWKQAVDDGVAAGVDAFIVADIAVAAYVAERYPEKRLHLSVQAGASSAEAIRYYCREFCVSRVVLPRVLTIAEIRAVSDSVECEIEAFVFGNIGMMAEGRCSLTNYVTGLSTNMDGVCSPASDVHYERDAAGGMSSRLGEFVIDCVGCGENAGYPTVCKGRYTTDQRRQPYYAFEEPISLNLSTLLPDLVQAGVSALKIEGRQRSRAYVQAVVAAFRKAVDDVVAGRVPDTAHLLSLTEGRKQTQGAYRSKSWR